MTTTNMVSPTTMLPIHAAVIVLLSIQIMVLPLVQANREGRQDESCHMRELDLCVAPIAVFTQSANDHQINNAELNRQCKVLNEIEGCLGNFTQRCLTGQQEKLVDMVADGGLQTIRDLCKPKSKLRESYLKHADCINDQQKEQRACLRDFQAALEKAQDIIWQDRLKLACCSFNRLNACSRDIIQPKCGPEAYELSRTLFKASFSRMPSITCTRYEHNSKSCVALLPVAGTVPKGAKSHSILSKLFSTYTGLS